MATKSAAKKTTKKPAAKRPAAKATRAPRATASTTKVRTSKVPKMQSFRRAEPTEPFFSFKITDQTNYWLILSFIVLLLGVWVTSINIKVQHIYDEIDASNAYINSLPDPIAKKS